MEEHHGLFIFFMGAFVRRWSQYTTNKKSHRDSCMHFSNFRSVQSLNCRTPALTHFSYEAPGIATHNLSVKVKIVQHCSSSVRHLSTSIFLFVQETFFFIECSGTARRLAQRRLCAKVLFECRFGFQTRATQTCTRLRKLGSPMPSRDRPSDVQKSRRGDC